MSRRLVVDVFTGFNKLVDGMQVEPDEKPWYGVRLERLETWGPL